MPAHSVELMFDPDTDARVRGLWDGIADAGLRRPSATSRPHVTLLAAEQISPEVDELLAPVVARLPIPCRVGAPMVFAGNRALTLVRLVVPSAELLGLHALAFEVCLPHLPHGPLPNGAPGDWTPHATLARRVEPAQLEDALALPDIARDIDGAFTGLRRWDGTARVEYPL